MDQDKRGPKPPIDLEEMSPKDIQNLTKDELEAMPHTVKKWVCCVKECERFTKVKDCGLTGFVIWKGRLQIMIARIWLCGKHFKPYKAGQITQDNLKPGSGIDHLQNIKNDKQNRTNNRRSGSI